MSGSGLVTSHVQGVTVVSVRVSSLLDTREIDDVGKALYEIVDGQACRKLIVDFSAVTFLASQMLGVLVSLDNKARAIKGKVVLCGLNRKIMEVFKITRLDKRLNMADDEPKAMGMFKAF